MSARPLQVGDLCITINALNEINNGTLVVIVGINTTLKDSKGNSMPYLIRRVDGQPHAIALNTITGEPMWYRTIQASCAGYKLRRVDEDGNDTRDVTVKRKRKPRPVTA